jgi:SAM-dependent methyltransferase
MSGKFDLVVCMLGTLSHMLTNSQAAAAFKAAAQHLRPGGLLLLELAHPGACVRYG